MKRYKKLICIMLCAVMMIGAFTGCSGKDEKNGIVVSAGTTLFDDSLDPIKGGMYYGYPFVNEALLKAAPDSEYVGCLATDWEMVDATTYKFTLREGVKFSNGTDFTAEDVVFTYETVMNNQALNQNVDLSSLESVTANGDYEVIFKLNKPYSPFFDATAMLQIVPSDSYDATLFDTMPIGTGAYKVVQYDTNQQIILEANENYWGEAPDIERVTLVYMDESAAFAAAKSGNLDIVMVSVSYADEKIEGMKYVEFDTMDVRNISMPTGPVRTVTNPRNGEEITVGNDVTSDINVRKALAIGIDRETVIKNCFNGVGRPTVNYTENLVWTSKNGYEDNRKEEAKQILTDAGWTDTDGDGIREKNGVKCAFDVYATSGDDDRYRLVSAVAVEAKELGIEITAKTATWGEIEVLQYTQGVIWGWGQFSPTVIRSLYHSDTFLVGTYDNVGGYDNPQVDALIDAAITAESREEATQNWIKAQDIANADYPYLYTVNIRHGFFISDKVDVSMDTQIPHPHGHGAPIINNMADWSWKQ
ncbi:MAG: ABC transporter substrate-binding protein [Anaerofustis stercorihominis]|nr:ABC transporter substrate-binding protein [Anaerofustis stercorihominis]